MHLYITSSGIVHSFYLLSLSLSLSLSHSPSPSPKSEKPAIEYLTSLPSAFTAAAASACPAYIFVSCTIYSLYSMYVCMYVCIFRYRYPEEADFDFSFEEGCLLEIV